MAKNLWYPAKNKKCVNFRILKLINFSPKIIKIWRNRVISETTLELMIARDWVRTSRAATAQSPAAPVQLPQPRPRPRRPRRTRRFRWTPTAWRRPVCWTRRSLSASTIRCRPKWSSTASAAAAAWSGCTKCGVPSWQWWVIVDFSTYLHTPLSTLGKSASPAQLRSRVDVSQFAHKNTVIESGCPRAGGGKLQIALLGAKLLILQ